MTPNELYTLEEAERLKRAYSCWINKAAHIGNGRIAILTEISVKRKRFAKSEMKTDKKYSVVFSFSKNIKLSAFEFLLTNGLVSAPANYTAIINQHNAYKN